MWCMLPVSQIINNLLNSIKVTWDLVSLQISYVVDRKLNFEKLIEKAQDLYAKRDDVNEDIKRNNVSKVPTEECKRWLENVQKFEDKVKDIAAKLDDKRYLIGFFPDVCWQREVGKCVMDMINDVNDLTEQSNFARGLLVDAPLAVAEEKPMQSVEEGTTIDRKTQEILGWLREERVRKIGVWGLGGVGKTTVMKNVNNLLETTQMFEIIIWVTVSSDGNRRMVQKQVSERLSLKLSNDDSDNAVARNIYQNLKRRKFMLILDDVWEILNLDDIGIPTLDEEKNSKVVLTTRSLEVGNRMDTDKEIKVEILPTYEAWKLFYKKVGEVVDHPNIQHLARCVLQECDGLPLAIVVIGGALKNKSNVHIWENALKELSSPDTTERKDMEEQVFKILKFSYDHLDDDNIRNCFLYTALYPDDAEIPILELIEYWILEGFIDTRRSLEEARNKGHEIGEKLVDASLLERATEDEYVKIHDLLRDMALKITSPRGQGSRFLVRAGVEIKETPAEEEWIQAVRISLMNNRLNNLLESPRCPNLSTLLLQLNYSLNTIPETFFMHMGALRVLDLSNTSIRSLPSSLSFLVSLRGLIMSGCSSLMNIPRQVRELRGLQVLNIDNCYSLDYLPDEIGELTHLRSLVMLFVYDRERLRSMTRSEVIGKLSHLEELRIRVAVDQFYKPGIRAVIDELKSLKRITSLELRVPDVELLDNFIQGSPSWQDGRLASFKFVVSEPNLELELGVILSDAPPMKLDRILACVSVGYITSGIKKVLTRADHFFLYDQIYGNRLSDFVVENMNELKRCDIVVCKWLKIIIDVNSEAEYGDALLSKLEMLRVIDSPYLKSFWEGPVPAGSLGSLKYFVLTKCEELSQIFPKGLIQQLSNLKYLRISYCRGPNILIDVRNEENYSIAILPKLEKLEVYNLKRLQSFWEGPVPAGSLASLKYFELSDCEELSKIFPKGLIQLLSNLKYLRISTFRGPEILIDLRSEEITNCDSAIFPNLERLNVVGTERLQSLCEGPVSPGSFGRLIVLRLVACPALKQLFTRGMIRNLSNLEDLTVRHCGIESLYVEEIVECDLLPELKTLELFDLKDLVSICNGVLTLPSLETISIEFCLKLKRLPLGIDSAAGTLKRIDGEREWWEALEWEDDAIKLRLLPFCVLREAIESDNEEFELEDMSSELEDE